MQLGDLGHFRGSNKENADRRFNDDGSAFFDNHLRWIPEHAAQASGSAMRLICTCLRCIDIPLNPLGAGGFYAQEAKRLVSLLWAACRAVTTRRPAALRW